MCHPCSDDRSGSCLSTAMDRCCSCSVTIRPGLRRPTGSPSVAASRPARRPRRLPCGRCTKRQASGSRPRSSLVRSTAERTRSPLREWTMSATPRSSRSELTTWSLASMGSRRVRSATSLMRSGGLPHELATGMSLSSLDLPTIARAAVAALTPPAERPGDQIRRSQRLPRVRTPRPPFAETRPARTDRRGLQLARSSRRWHRLHAGRRPSGSRSPGRTARGCRR